MGAKITPFQKKVYEVLTTIPEGYVTTYKHIAEAVGINCSLAVGQALKRNPFAPQVPCHRVIASDLSLGGYAGARAGKLVEKKRELLENEGVEFVGNYLKDSSKLYKPKKITKEE